jgi:hypothetical protein
MSLQHRNVKHYSAVPLLSVEVTTASATMQWQFFMRSKLDGRSEAPGLPILQR